MKLIKLSWLSLLFLISTYGETRPNILFLFSDDHALRTIGAYPGSIKNSPNLDRIAKEGALLADEIHVNSFKIEEGNGSLANPFSSLTKRWRNRGPFKERKK